jgi:type IV pilus assembly protein PilY1
MHRPWPTRTLACAGRALALMSLAGSAGAQYAVSQLPALTPAPPTNIVMTVDDSGSMQWAYVPDGMGNNTGTRAFLAATFNALSYNPKIVYPPPVMITGAGAQTLVSSFTAAPIDGFNTATGTVDLSSAYRPTASYSPGSTNQQFSPAPSQDLALICSPAANCNGAPAYYYVYNATLTNCSSQATDDNCYQYVRVSATSGPNGTDERQNFANWYSFYRIRHLMIASAAAITMADPTLTQARVTWRDFWTCTDFTSGNNCRGWDGSVVDNRIRTFTGTQQTNFYKWLSRVPANNSTPTRGAWEDTGDYFSRTDLGANGPYGINPNPTTGTAPSGEVACVQNYNITLTDGQWNGESDNFFGAADTQSTALPANPPAPTVPPPPYAASKSPPTAIYGNDSNHDVLADIAFHYWANNLRPDLPGSATAVTPYYQVTTGVNGASTTADYWNPQNDPATWPHLVQITIGIGMTNTMTAAGLPWWGNNPATQYLLSSTSNAGYYNLWNGNLAWPTINNGAGQGDMGKAYDLWHAAINSRGLAFSAESPADLIGALKASLNRIKVTMSSQSALATSSTKLSNGTFIYAASYSSSDWHGTLSEYGITGGVIDTTPTWATSTASFQPAGTRSIVTSNTAGAAATPSVHSGIEFSSASAPFNALWGSVSGANAAILSWLRGDTKQELSNGGLYRNRPASILGDIIDSGPEFAWHENFGYAGLPEGGNYLTFISTKASTAGSIYSGKGMVYVGANDGMLHGFDAATGNEVFGYVPHNVIPNLPALADPAYAHQDYVDQTPYVGDACVGSGPTSCTWKTVLIGTTGAGGQGVFALDVTDPTTMESAGSAVGNVMWDLDGKGSNNPNGDPDLGYPIGKPIIARLNNGDWSAIFGNGYLSSNGCAVLFIVRLADGAVTRIGTTGSTGTTVCTATNINASNGLGPVTLADVDGNMTTDYVYAGDLQGNMWKFDLTSAASGSWAPKFGYGTPLFTASAGGGSCVRPAGSNAPDTCKPITSAPVLGPALPGMSGTMLYFGTGRMFAVGDLSTTSTQTMYGILDNGTSPVSGGHGALTQETATDNGTTRTFSNNPVQPPKQGWYMDLPDPGERVTFSPLPVNGFVVFASQVPTSSICSAGGTGWIMAVPATSNSFGAQNTFFLGLNVNGIQATNGMPESLTVLSDNSSKNRTEKLIIGETGGPQTAPTPPPSVTGRISWHELVR